jgi:hypothetical protein
MRDERELGLLPIMSPVYNMREITKQMALLEDHLNHPRKRCHDCIRKHFLTIEALYEEAISLDKEGKHRKVLGGKAQEVRDLQGAWLDGCVDKKGEKVEDVYLMISQGIRGMRKEMAPLCFDVRKLASMRVASRYLSSRGG